MPSDEYFMKEALMLSKMAGSLGEVPVGALVVCDGIIVGRGFNRREISNQAYAHAEVLAIKEASMNLGRWRLYDCSLYVTLEPCIMCAGLIVQARMPKVVFGALDPKFGGVESLYQILNDKRLNHRVTSVSSLLSEESAKLLRDFFQQRRKK